MQINTNNFQKFLAKLELNSEESHKFCQALTSSSQTNTALLWITEIRNVSQLECPAWFPDFATLVTSESKPGKNQLHQDGNYYCLDSSSLFCMSAVLQLPKNLDLVIDMCSSPGGKAIYAWRALKPKTLICNEAISKRVGALISNLKRCQISQCKVFSADSDQIAYHFQHAAQLVIVDAPCSGQSLLAKGIDAPGCFHPAVINTNANRQRRILANSAGCVELGGHLLYSTCTYSIKENEDTIKWFLKKFPNFEAVEIESLEGFRSKYTDLACYRLWPWQDGAGSFACLLRCKDSIANDYKSAKTRENDHFKGRELKIRWQN